MTTWGPLGNLAPPARKTTMARLAGGLFVEPHAAACSSNLDVPDFSNGSAMMSGLALAAASELGRRTTGSDKARKQRFPAPPPALRTFSAAEEISVSGEIYSNEKSPVAIETTTTAQRPSGDVVFRHRSRAAGALLSSCCEALWRRPTQIA